jgi:hypothetical protein
VAAVVVEVVEVGRASRFSSTNVSARTSAESGATLSSPPPPSSPRTSCTRRCPGGAARAEGAGARRYSTACAARTRAYARTAALRRGDSVLLKVFFRFCLGRIEEGAGRKKKKGRDGSDE